MTRQQRTRRASIWAGTLTALIFYGLIMFLPAIGGMITAEQPIPTYPR